MIRKHQRLALALLAATMLGAAGAALANVMVEVPAPANILAAVADKARPEADTKLDAERQARQTLYFAGVKTGQKVVDLFPGGGYFTRLFSTAVGDGGHVYALQPAELLAMRKVTADQATEKMNVKRANVTVLFQPAETPAAPEPVDLVFTAQNYHDYHDPFLGPADLAKVNGAVFRMLKPGGLYVVIDHAAPDGSGLASTNTTHRIDEAVVKKEVEAAGFKLIEEGTFLRNPDDKRDKLVFDPAIRHHTDQFVLKFRKPG